MTRWAKLTGNVVENVVEQNEIPTIPGQWQDAQNAGPGWAWDGDSYSPPAAVAAPYAWSIDIGPFFDRFGAAKMAVLTSADAGVKAILTDVQIRKWIDLQRADVATSLAYIGSVVPSVTAELQTAILTTPVSEAENLALRKLYFS